MNKEQLKEAVGELNLVDTEFEVDGMCYMDKAVSVTQVYDLIDQLDEPEKVVIPKFVADHIKFSKGDDSPRNSMGEAHINKGLNDWLAKTKDYMTYSNQEKFMRAWLDGYEIEKEELYYVLNKHGQTLLVSIGGTVCLSSGCVLRDDNKALCQLTEKQIKDYDERYWSFAVEVVE